MGPVQICHSPHEIAAQLQSSSSLWSEQDGKPKMVSSGYHDITCADPVHVLPKAQGALQNFREQFAVAQSRRRRNLVFMCNPSLPLKLASKRFQALR